jgi:hypothetical protein
MQDEAQPDRFRRGWLAGVAGGAILVLACAIAAYLLASLVDLLRPGTLLSDQLWFLDVNLYVGLPWLLAIGLSPILKRWRARARPAGDR